LFARLARSAPSEKGPSPRHAGRAVSATSQSRHAARRSTPLAESTHPKPRFAHDLKRGECLAWHALLPQSRLSRQASLPRIPRLQPNPLCLAQDFRPQQSTPQPPPAHRAANSSALSPHDSPARKKKIPVCFAQRWLLRLRVAAPNSPAPPLAQYEIRCTPKHHLSAQL